MDIRLHAGQLKVYRDRHQFRSCVSGRRFGKTRLMLNELLIAALSFEGTPSAESPETVLGAMPTLAMARDILWQPLVNICERADIAPAVANINRSSFQIDFHSKPSIKIAGANDRNGDGLRGKRIYFAGLDEYQDFRPGILDNVIIPAMADTGGSRALITGTPKGMLNHLYALFQRRQTDPERYASFSMPTATNPLISREFLEQQRLILPPRVYQQEFEADFVAFAGQIYSELSEQHNRVATRPSDDPAWYDHVIVGVDFGDVHPAFSVWGAKDRTLYWLEGWQGDTGLAIAQPEQDRQLVRLARRWRPGGCFCDPSRPSAILGIRDLGHQHNLRGLKRAVAGFNRIDEGITQLHSLIYQRRMLFPRAPHNETPGAVDGNRAFVQFQSYRYRIDRWGQVIQKPEEGQDDHGCDSSRYALAINTGALGLDA